MDWCENDQNMIAGFYVSAALGTEIDSDSLNVDSARQHNSAVELGRRLLLQWGLLAATSLALPLNVIHACRSVL